MDSKKINKTFKCELCDYRCSQKTSLQRHQRKHSGDKPFKCDLCDYRCSHKTSLQNHQRKHS